MNSSDPVIVGLTSFLLWAGLSACCFLAAAVLARFSAKLPQDVYNMRVVYMFVLLIVWLFCMPLGRGAYVGDNTRPEPRARWEAKQTGRTYGSHTIWAWGLVALLHRPKIATRELRTC